MNSAKFDTVEFRLLITGGRKFTDAAVIEKALMDIDVRPDVVIHGDSTGADRVAGDIAEKWGIDVWKFPAQWARFGKAAGPRRNHQMIVEGRPTHVLAFPGDAGTENMIKQASKAGLLVRRISADGEIN
tara:strand:+ start:80 stop:466 length:387 start_codon:yes stop_codon:yes gene_type:complete